ncbi:type II toxin-antitoxin system prevent-host-death family antitoxin [Intestinimonas butyriciproducens]|uniref:type II toxin-antitoxin system prevent-host-death family antitoxin n=1 Tax=Intestinimonas butyriciproducens TaxID=1297617 RepID=UPI001A9CB0BB|nr:type II toxin-antitoxin system prevent-host-death family antitoxin [Intestinimonas butyriciproducens]
MDEDLLLAEKETICISRDGKVVAKLSDPARDRVDIAKSLFGDLPQTVPLEQAIQERLAQI